MAKRVFVTGGTGFIGRALVKALLARGDEAIVLSRNAARAHEVLGDNVAVIEGDPTLAGDWQDMLRGVDAVVNLAGRSINDRRWDAQFKQLLHDSRVETTRYLVEGIAALDPDDRPAVLVSASGQDYYPFAVDLGAALDVDEDEEVVESMASGDTFLARMCRNWEAEAKNAESLGVRVVRVRLGVVLGKEGGALPTMIKPFQLYVGGYIGRGRQWFSWIHLTDAVGAMLFAIDDESLVGPVNLVAPNAVRAAEFASAVGTVLGRPSWTRMPGAVAKLAVGELAEYLVHGRRSVPRALLDHGFTFAYPDIQPALAEILAS